MAEVAWIAIAVVVFIALTLAAFVKAYGNWPAHGCDYCGSWMDTDQCPHCGWESDQ